MSSVPTPGGGGCPIVLGALAVAVILVIVAVAQFVHFVVWAVTSW